MMNDLIKRGDILLINLESKIGSSIQSGTRPCVVISNEKANQFSPVITVVPLTSKVKKMMPTHVYLGIESNLVQDSIVLCEQIMTISKSQIDHKLGECPQYKIKLIDRAIKIQTSMLTPIDYNYISDKVFSIRKLKELCDMCRGDNQDLNKMYELAIKDLKFYCNDYGKSYTEFYNDIKDNNTQIAKAI